VRSEQDIVAALKALAKAEARVEASPELESRVRRAFRARQVRRKWNRAAVWTLAAAAVVIAMFVVRQPRAAVQHVVQERPVVTAPAQDSVPAPISVPVKLQRSHVTRQPREIVTEFFPLIDAPPPMDRGEVFRVTVPAAAMRTVGLPVAEDRLTDRVQADVLVSEEGLATAIRFVRNE
jgi:hypothetical protein